MITSGIKTVDYIWMGGKIIPWEQATVHVNLLGHATVASVYEGIKAYWNADKGQLFAFRLDEHLRRFMDSVKMVRLNCKYTQKDLGEAVLSLIQANKLRENCYISPLIYETGIIRSYTHPDLSRPTEVVIDMWPSASQLTSERAIDCCLSSWTRISDNSSPSRIKCVSNYHNGRLASLEALINGYDLPIILNDRGKVSEGPGACIFIVRGGKAITPSITSDILESITRASILQICQEVLHIPVEEREVDRTELYVADEMFFCGTWWEVMPVASVDRLPVGNGKMGPITMAIDKAYHDIVRGMDARYEDWRTPVW
jgi:branched-chain amino acid aminotransferase